MHRRLPSASLLRQKRNQKKTVRFNVMVAGSGGSGKSTLINTLCGREVANTTEWIDEDPANANNERPIRLRTYMEDIIDPDVGTITLKFIETIGLGDNISNQTCIDEILNYLEQQFDDVLAEESRIKRNPKFTDNRLHAMIYMIEATGHGLREHDVEFLRTVGPRVNVIPVIAKSDALTPGEVLLNKRLIKEDFEHYGIPIYQFADLEELQSSDEEPEPAEVEANGANSGAGGVLSGVQNSLPFTIIGSNGTIETSDGRTVLARTYRWGSLEVEDPHVSDLPLLRDLLLYSHMNDLKETTFDDLYERFRTLRLSDEPKNDGGSNLGSGAGSAANAGTSGHIWGQPPAALKPPGPVHIPAGQFSPTSASGLVASPTSVTSGSTSSALRGPQPRNTQKPGQDQGLHGSAAGANAAANNDKQRFQPPQVSLRQPSYLAREEQLRAEEAKLAEQERLLNKELEARRQELLKREAELRALESRLREEAISINSPAAADISQFSDQ